MKIQHFVTDFFDTNVYLFEKNNKCFMVDCGGSVQDTKRRLASFGIWPDFLLLTHGHIDHISSLSLFENSDTQIIIHSADQHYLCDPSFNLSTAILGQAVTFDLLCANEEIDLSQYGIEIIHTPGHSPGSVCYRVEDVLFSGDTLFCQGIGNTSFPGGDALTEMNSVRQLLEINDNLTVYPGHGPSTTIFKERKSF